MDISKLEAGSPDCVNVLITSEKGSKEYCELDSRSGTFILRKVLSLPFPGFYGFVPKTRGIGTGCIEVLVLTVENIRQDMIVEARPIGVIRMKGKVPEDILVAVLVNDSAIKTQDLLTLNEEELEELKNFLEELKGGQLQEAFGAEHARKSFQRASELYERESR